MQVIISMAKAQVDKAFRGRVEHPDPPADEFGANATATAVDPAGFDSDSAGVVREQLMGRTHWDDPKWPPFHRESPARRTLRFWGRLHRHRYDPADQ